MCVRIYIYARLTLPDGARLGTLPDGLQDAEGVGNRVLPKTLASSATVPPVVPIAMMPSGSPYSPFKDPGFQQHQDHGLHGLWNTRVLMAPSGRMNSNMDGSHRKCVYQAVPVQTA